MEEHEFHFQLLVRRETGTGICQVSYENIHRYLIILYPLSIYTHVNIYIYFTKDKFIGAIGNKIELD